MNPLIYDTKNIKNNKIIVALDFDNLKNTLNFVTQIDPTLCKVKIGKELFTACGPKIIEILKVHGFDIFLDLKFHDIPHTVFQACKVACDLEVWMLNVHTLGGFTMLSHAKQAINESKHKPLLIGVTLLTSMLQNDLDEIGLTKSLEEEVHILTNLAYKAGLDGVVCSAKEALTVKHLTHKSFLTITPGIRFEENLPDDQKRTVNIETALISGTDYLVIGRPITKSSNPYETLIKINQIINTNTLNQQ